MAGARLVTHHAVDFEICNAESSTSSNLVSAFRAHDPANATSVGFTPAWRAGCSQPGVEIGATPSG